MTKTLRIIGIPMDLGQNQRGVDMGPSAIRYAGLTSRLQKLGYTITDTGNLAVPLRSTLPGQSQSILLGAIEQACTLAYQAAMASIQSGEIPIFLGGDHSVAVGTIGGISHTERSAVLWIDAHGDFNTPQTSLSGNFHGMALAALLGQGPENMVNLGRPGPKLFAEDVVILGIRDLDKPEKSALKKSGITIYTMRDIDERGISSIIHEALTRVSHCPRLHVSLDMDCVDPMAAPGVGTPSHGGLTYREAQLIMEIIADSKRLSSLDIVEVNPILDQKNITAEVAVELAVSLFGKSIL